MKDAAMKVGAHIGGMKKILIPALLLIGLAGCNQWDEVAERAVCNNAFPRNSTKAQACYDGRKLAYDARLAKGRNAEWK
jgi:hypothetical protein